MTTDPAGLIDALHTSAPHPAHAADLALFGQFIGSWTLDWESVDEHGQVARATGELHFGWVLGGRAVQDVWIVPGRGSAGEGEPPLGFYGTTVRFYDPAIGAWRSTWVEPVNGRVRRFIGRPVDGGIELLSVEDDPQLRWRFSDIGPDSFVWSAETSYDAGLTWVADEVMRARRV